MARGRKKLSIDVKIARAEELLAKLRAEKEGLSTSPIVEQIYTYSFSDNPPGIRQVFEI